MVCAAARRGMLGAVYSCARSEEAWACELAFNRSSILRSGDCSSREPTAVAPTAGVPTGGRRKAWITLLTNKKYAVGVKALYNSISEVDSEHPLDRKSVV